LKAKSKYNVALRSTKYCTPYYSINNKLLSYTWDAESGNGNQNIWRYVITTVNIIPLLSSPRETVFLWCCLVRYSAWTNTEGTIPH